MASSSTIELTCVHPQFHTRMMNDWRKALSKSKNKLEAAKDEHKEQLQACEQSIKWHQDTIKTFEDVNKLRLSSVETRGRHIKAFEESEKQHEATIKELEDTEKKHEATIKELEHTVETRNTVLTWHENDTIYHARRYKSLQEEHKEEQKAAKEYRDRTCELEEELEDKDDKHREDIRFWVDWSGQKFDLVDKKRVRIKALNASNKDLKACNKRMAQKVTKKRTTFRHAFRAIDW